jgi:hypothetical protein
MLLVHCINFIVNNWSSLQRHLYSPKILHDFINRLKVSGQTVDNIKIKYHNTNTPLSLNFRMVLSVISRKLVVNI